MNFKKTFSFQETVLPHNSMTPISKQEMIERRSLQSVLKDFVPRLRPKISLITPSPLSLIPKQFDLILDDGDEETNLELIEEDTDTITTQSNTNASVINDQDKKVKSKSVFTEKVNEWYNHCNDKLTSIIEVLELIQKDK